MNEEVINLAEDMSRLTCSASKRVAQWKYATYREADYGDYDGYLAMNAAARDHNVDIKNEEELEDTKWVEDCRRAVRQKSDWYKYGNWGWKKEEPFQDETDPRYVETLQNMVDYHGPVNGAYDKTWGIVSIDDKMGIEKGKQLLSKLEKNKAAEEMLLSHWKFEEMEVNIAQNQASDKRADFDARRDYRGEGDGWGRRKPLFPGSIEWGPCGGFRIGDGISDQSGRDFSGSSWTGKHHQNKEDT